eukprot:Polyplicarium_translucidae@DN2605_c0_g1_i1.p2
MSHGDRIAITSGRRYMYLFRPDWDTTDTHVTFASAKSPGCRERKSVRSNRVPERHPSRAAATSDGSMSMPIAVGVWDNSSDGRNRRDEPLQPQMPTRVRMTPPVPHPRSPMYSAL